jgi:division protein CdvB (Snf7/Vps24/ESCRT-III family)
MNVASLIKIPQVVIHVKLTLEEGNVVNMIHYFWDVILVKLTQVQKCAAL